jgi:uncharacterized membrane protein YhdT
MQPSQRLEMPPRRPGWRTLASFAQDVYAPGLHIAFSAAWFLALDSGLSALRGLPVWHVTAPLSIGVLFFALFYLRVADEWKDYDYDVVYNPERPLVKGTVRFADLYWFLGATALAALVCHAVARPSVASTLVLVSCLLYGYLLAPLERLAPVVRDNMLLNLAVTYPVNVSLSIYIWASWLGRTGQAPAGEDLAWIGAFALAFLHYEFARKISWPERAKPGKRLYSAALGVPVALAACVAFAAGAIALAMILFSERSAIAWLFAVPLLPVLAGTVWFLRGKGVSSTPLTPFAMLFLTLFYVAGAAVAAYR